MKTNHMEKELDQTQQEQLALRSGQPYVLKHLLRYTLFNIDIYRKIQTGTSRWRPTRLRR